MSYNMLAANYESDERDFQYQSQYPSSGDQFSAELDGEKSSSETKILYNEAAETGQDEPTPPLNQPLAQEDMSDDMTVDNGEPLTSQHVRIDFTPLEGVDHSDYLLKKCMDFWKLVEGSKTLQHLKALPEKDVVASVKSTTDSGSSTSFLLHGDFPPPRQGAVEVMAEKGKTINDCLVTKMQQLYCEDGGGDYFADLPPSKSGMMTKWTTNKSGRPKSPTRAQRKELSKMCRELEQWDLNHPKSMEPPNHGPPHTYAVMQGKL